MGMFKWLYPGMRVKRWVFLCSFGIILCSIGFVLTITEVQKTSGSLIVLLGTSLVVVSIRKIIKSIVTVLLPQKESELVNIMYQKRYLERGPRIVVIGGGSGLAVLLHGLKEHTSNITAVVTVADDGGSSGRLRSQFNIPPPGDIRNCLVALADAEPMMSDLFQFRFEGESGEFEGHNFGNLFILAMLKVTGDFEKAIRESSKILAIRGRVVPATLKRVSLLAHHADGTVTEGESNISKVKSPVDRLYLKPEGCSATEDALTAIQNADAIVIGPGSLYTSLLPNLLIEDLANAVAASAAPKIYICNVMTQPHETDALTAFDHVNVIVEHTRPDILSHVIVHSGQIPQNTLTKYAKEEAYPVTTDTARIRELGYTVIESSLAQSADMIRHNPRKVSKIIMDIVSASKKIRSAREKRPAHARTR
ncbi:MAG: uridine diphosphate-N-acetylglucosamine-binding protein YvcK [Candidatus Omnitrophica bacterium]|nr:uridine diphosphate-N-acetylglucosamine-binding protein YvcK [Candidatus Omnitrophota bacterium]